MELKELCGKHILQGVDRYQFEREVYWGGTETVNAIRFRLDGITYLAVEDPSDGYRSYCEELIAVDDLPRYMIPDTEVVCSMMPDDVGIWSESKDILVITDAMTGLSVLEVGTGNVGDWYPYCHFEYHPENLMCNQ